MPYPLAEEMLQVINPDGEVVGDLPDLADDTLISFYRWMLLGRMLSAKFVALQRQGRLGTFGQLDGQEGTLVGLAAPLEPKDWVMGSYREVLSYLIKGVPLAAILKSVRGHIGVRYPEEANVLPYQIVLATQMQHGAGIAMGMAYEQQPNAVVAVCGDGATSEGDFNESLNFAAVFNAPLVAVIQNNGWAISVPREKQSAADYLAHRGPAFGMPGHIVDGNDVLAVYKIVSECLTRAKEGGGPSLIEAINYRLGPHTTADDPTKYRSDEELEEMKLKDPMVRYKTFLMDRGLLTDDDVEQMRQSINDEMQEAIEEMEETDDQNPADMFDLVFEEQTPQLRRQKAALLRSLEGE